jgi:hypothetical protein
MTILITFIVGFLIGIGASPNPMVGLICGGFLALIVWAITGFKIGDTTVDDQGVSLSIKKVNEGLAPDGTSGKFMFSDGKSFTPEEFGYLAVRLGSQGSADDIGALFGSGQPGDALGLGKEVNKDRSGAEMIATMLSTAVYLWYAVYQLKVNEAVIGKIIKGIRDSLGDFRTDSGKGLPSEFVEFLIQILGKFTPEIQQDVIEGSGRDSGALRSIVMPSSRLFLTTLIGAYSHDQKIQNTWEDELNGAQGTMVGSLTADSSLAVMVTLSKQFQVKYYDQKEE